MNILDLPGPAFLTVYLTVMLVGTVAAFTLRSAVRKPRQELDARRLDLRPAEIAYLAGGERQAVEATVAALAHRELVTVDRGGRTLSATAVNRSTADPLETDVHRVLTRGAQTIEQVTRTVAPLLEPIRRDLMRIGLLEPDDIRWKLRLVPAIVIAAVVALGLAKISIGLARDRPVGFLVVLTVIAAVETLWFLARPPSRTRTGDSVLSAIKARYSALRTTAKLNASRVTPDDLALAVGLYGVSVLLTSTHAPIGRAMSRTSASSGSSTNGGSSCSSGSSGCGGGGGGGCGGCGGD